MKTVSGSNQHEISATASVAKPIAPITPGTPTPAADSPSTTATMPTVESALRTLLAAITRERFSASVQVCRMA